MSFFWSNKFDLLDDTSHRFGSTPFERDILSFFDRVLTLKEGEMNKNIVRQFKPVKSPFILKKSASYNTNMEHE